MRIGILSDTHDRLDRTKRAVKLLVDSGAEALIHCGDLTEPDIVYECSVLPSTFVFGNNEEDFDGIRAAITAIQGVCLEFGGEISLANRRIAVSHGHLGKTIRRLAAASPDYLCFGHSHVAGDTREGPTRWINPGALHRAESYSVAMLDLLEDDLKFLNVR